MKVGDILKSEIKDIPRLKYPYKIMINENCKYPYRQKLDNAILFENCNNLINTFSSNKSLRKHRSYSQKKCLKYDSPALIKEYFFKKHSDNLNQFFKPKILSENLPLIGDIQRDNYKLSSSKTKIFNTVFNECLIIRKKIKKLKNETNNIKSLTFYNQKEENKIIHDFKEGKSLNHIYFLTFWH